MKDEFDTLTEYMNYFIENLSMNTKFYLFEIYTPQWQAAWSNPEEVLAKLKWDGCNYKHLSFEQWKDKNERV